MSPTRTSFTYLDKGVFMRLHESATPCRFNDFIDFKTSMATVMDFLFFVLKIIVMRDAAYLYPVPPIEIVMILLYVSGY